MRVEGQKVSKIYVFLRFEIFGATLCGNPAVECQKLRVFCDFFWSGGPLSGKTGVECQKLRFFCDFGVPEFVLRSVLTIRFATYGRFSKRSKMSENRQKTLKTEGFWPFLHDRICPNDLFCYIRPSPRLSRGAPRWFQRGFRGFWNHPFFKITGPDNPTC